MEARLASVRKQHFSNASKPPDQEYIPSRTRPSVKRKSKTQYTEIQPRRGIARDEQHTVRSPWLHCQNLLPTSGEEDVKLKHYSMGSTGYRPALESRVPSYTPSTSRSDSDDERMIHGSPAASSDCCSGNHSLMYESVAENRSANLASIPNTQRSHRLLEDARSRSTTSSDVAGVKRSASSDDVDDDAYQQHLRKRPASHQTATACRSLHKTRQSTLAEMQQLARVPINQLFNEPKPFSECRVDSGYVSRSATMQSQPTWSNAVPPVCSLLTEPIPGFEQAPKKQIYPQAQAVTQNPHKMYLQPVLGQVTQEQLAAEVKGIYAGLVMVEAKSINVDAEQSADRTKPLAPKQWQQLIALRRTLLYEHHDFLMATQHPAANPALRALAAKYCMPARMWKHGIHGFLEVLRHRRPESQEYMLTFIYLAYDMMALLFETVPAFTDTWIECLGDLARYRMAIEEDKEIHAIWGGVAGRWYTMAADRHPQIGRLYHHLGILERPSLRKLYFYSRSLTSVVPFVNARESLGTLCAPILQGDQTIRCGPHSAEAITICFHARVFANQDISLLERDGREALALLKDQPAGKISSYAAPLAVTNIASLFEFGLQDNIFRQMFAADLARAAHNARPSTTFPIAVPETVGAVGDNSIFQRTTYPSPFVVEFMVECFNATIRRDLVQATVRDLLQFVHVNMIFFSALLDLRMNVTIEAQRAVLEDVLLAVDWECLATFLNALIQIDPISNRIEEHALFNTFLLPESPAERKPLAEDYLIRGLVWADANTSAGLFSNLEDDDGSRALETPARLHLRAERVEWLACLIAHPDKQSPLSYDRSTRQFGTRKMEPVSARRENVVSPVTLKPQWQKQSASPVLSEASATMSRHSSITDDYDMMSIRSDNHSRMSASMEMRPSNGTTESYVSVSPIRTEHQKLATGNTDEAIKVVDAETSY